jgi:hypothetical protein
MTVPDLGCEVKRLPKRQSSPVARHHLRPLDTRVKCNASIRKLTNNKFKKLERLQLTVQMARDAALKAKNQIERVEGLLDIEK